uniref:Uncharacterized protein n=1 Tax=Mola mola TaxID=94237 RepID=A0A3Q3WN17_MOLML
LTCHPVKFGCVSTDVFFDNSHFSKSVVQGEVVQQLREALKILAERVLILEHMIGIHGEEKNSDGRKRSSSNLAFLWGFCDGILARCCRATWRVTDPCQGTIQRINVVFTGFCAN